MVYLLYGNKVPLVTNRAKKIANSILGSIDEMNYIRYNCNDVTVQECVDEAINLPLGYDKKIVQIDNCSFLVKTKIKGKKINHDLSSLIEFASHPNEECIIILCAPSKDIATTSDLYKAIKENDGKIFLIAELEGADWIEGVRNFCLSKKNLNIDDSAIVELANRVEGDTILLENELTKLSLYTDHITYNDVCKLTKRPLDENSFLIFNYLLEEKNMEALMLYRDLKVSIPQPASLISMLGNQFRLLEESMYLFKKGFTNDQVATELAIKPGRAAILKKNSFRVSLKSIHRILEDLFLLDLKTKSGQIDDHSYAFELFLINFRRF